MKWQKNRFLGHKESAEQVKATTLKPFSNMNSWGRDKLKEKQGRKSSKI